MNNNDIGLEKLTLDNRKILTMNGVATVDGFTDKCLDLTVSGNKVKVFGENIKITSYNKNTGVLSAEGKINEIKYGVKKVPLVKKLFK